MQPGPGVDTPFAIHLALSDEKPPALHHGGLIDYGAGRTAPYYYSRTRLAVQGDLATADAAPEHVTGRGVDGSPVGQLRRRQAAAGTGSACSSTIDSEVMLYVLRDANGSTDVDLRHAGPARRLRARAQRPRHRIRSGSGRSPHTGATYPSGWQLTLPDGRRLQVEPVLQDQELYFPDLGGTIYWEGAVRVSGDATGQGYVELTGYV